MDTPLVDLHTHSTASDGSLSPRELVELAVKKGLYALALTDHDTLSGLEEAEEAAKGTPIQCIRGVEVSAKAEGGEVHLLGLWLPPKTVTGKKKEAYTHLESLLEHIRQLREERNLLILQNLNTLGVELTLQEVQHHAQGEVLARPHFARALVEKKYASSVEDAFRHYLGDQGAAFVKRETLSAEQAIGMLRDTGALVSLAHPGLLPYSLDVLETKLPVFKEAGLQALEGYYSTHSHADEAHLVRLAEKFQLGLTGGTDFHGTAKPDIQLGTGKGSVRFTRALFEILQSYCHAQGIHA